MTTYYKFLTADQHGPYSRFDYKPYLPKGKRPGKWLPKLDNLAMCSTGYHVCELKDWRRWARADLYLVETKGDGVHSDDKSAFGQIRLVRKVDTWNQDNLVRFAVKCARRQLKHYETQYPADKRVRDALKAATDYVDGKIDRDSLLKARVAAANAANAADAAAAYAANAAANAANAANAAYAANAAADAAAAYAAANAAYADVRSGERNWQDGALKKMLGL
jgi:hypothetical protein